MTQPRTPIANLLLLFTVLLTLTGSMSAATINVPADQGTIQAAINAAVSGQDEVVVSPGTYLEAINFNGKAITLRSASGDPADTIIDGTGNYHVVQCRCPRQKYKTMNKTFVFIPSLTVGAWKVDF